MQFNTILLASILSSTGALAQSNVQGFLSAYNEYIASVVGNPSIVSEIGNLATANPALLISLQGLATATPDVSNLANPPAIITALPSPLNGIFSSIYTHEIGLASQFGLISSGAAASVSSAVATGSASRISSSGSPISSSTGAAAAATSSSSSSSSGMTTTMRSSASGTSPSSSSSSGAASAPTGVAIMGVVAGVLGGVVALL